MTEHWHSDGEGWRGNWTIEVRGQPVTISATFELVPTRQGSRYTVAHSVKAKIPLVGKQVERYVLGQTAGGASDELKYASTYLD